MTTSRPPNLARALKLVAGRLRDQSDVEALLASGAVDVDACRALIAGDFPEHKIAFEQLLAKAGE